MLSDSEGPPADGMQVPRGIRFLHRENLLADAAQLSSNRRRPHEEVLQGETGCGDHAAAAAHDTGDASFIIYIMCAVYMWCVSAPVRRALFGGSECVFACIHGEKFISKLYYFHKKNSLFF